MNDNYIEGIFVKKAVQSKGIGKQLLNYAKEGQIYTKIKRLSEEQESYSILSARRI